MLRYSAFKYEFYFFYNDGEQALATYISISHVVIRVGENGDTLR